MINTLKLSFNLFYKYLRRRLWQLVAHCPAAGSFIREKVTQNIFFFLEFFILLPFASVLQDPVPHPEFQHPLNRLKRTGCINFIPYRFQTDFIRELISRIRWRKDLLIEQSVGMGATTCTILVYLWFWLYEKEANFLIFTPTRKTLYKPKSCRMSIHAHQNSHNEASQPDVILSEAKDLTNEDIQNKTLPGVGTFGVVGAHPLGGPAEATPPPSQSTGSHASEAKNLKNEAVGWDPYPTINCYSEPVFNKLLFILEHLPQCLKPKLGYTFTQNKKKEYYCCLTNLDNGNKIYGITSGKAYDHDDIFHGRHFTFFRSILLDDHAFHWHADHHWQHLNQFSASRIILSPPNGRSNLFSELGLYHKADIYRLHWILHPYYDRHWYNSMCKLNDTSLVMQFINIDYTYKHRRKNKKAAKLIDKVSVDITASLISKDKRKIAKNTIPNVSYITGKKRLYKKLAGSLTRPLPYKSILCNLAFDSRQLINLPNLFDYYNFFNTDTRKMLNDLELAHYRLNKYSIAWYELNKTLHVRAHTAISTIKTVTSAIKRFQPDKTLPDFILSPEFQQPELTPLLTKAYYINPVVKDTYRYIKNQRQSITLQSPPDNFQLNIPSSPADTTPPDVILSETKDLKNEANQNDTLLGVGTSDAVGAQPFGGLAEATPTPDKSTGSHASEATPLTEGVATEGCERGTQSPGMFTGDHSSEAMNKDSESYDEYENFFTPEEEARIAEMIRKDNELAEQRKHMTYIPSLRIWINFLNKPTPPDTS